MDTRMGFPCPFRNVVIDYISPTPYIYNKMPSFNVVLVVQSTTPWHRYLQSMPITSVRCKLSRTCERFPIFDDKITENDRCVVKIIGLHCTYGNLILSATSWRHNILDAKWRCKKVVSPQRVRHIGMRLIESTTSIGSRVTNLGWGWYDVTNISPGVAETGMWHHITRDWDLSLWIRY